MNKIYEKRLEEMNTKVKKSSIMEELEIKEITNEKLDKLLESMSENTQREVYNDFNFKTGKIFGILRFIMQNPLSAKELYEITGLNPAYIELFRQVGGNSPYTKDGVYYPSIPMDIEKCKQLIQATAVALGVYVSEEDLDDITQDRWDKIVQYAEERAKKTVQFHAGLATPNYEE